MYDLNSLFNQHSSFRAIEFSREERRKHLVLRQCKALLVDYSYLHIREIWKAESLTKYSYYWFTSGNQLIVGWDNAPHHPNLENFPHHKHTEKGIEASSEFDLPAVLECIAGKFDD